MGSRELLKLACCLLVFAILLPVNVMTSDTFIRLISAGLLFIDGLFSTLQIFRLSSAVCRSKEPH